MTQHLAVKDRPLRCCNFSQQRAITYNLRPESNDLSPQSARARLDQRLLDGAVCDVCQTRNDRQGPQGSCRVYRECCHQHSKYHRSGLRFRPPHRTYLSVDNFHDEGTGSRCDEKCQSLLPTLYMLMISVR